MKPHERRVGAILDRFLERFRDPSPSPEEMEAAGERVLQRLRSEAGVASEQSSFNLTPVRPAWKWSRRAIAASAAFAMVVILVSVVIAQRFVRQNAAHAVAARIEGTLYRISGEKVLAVQAGERIEAGEVLRTNGGAGAMLTLADGSHVEIRSQSMLSLERAGDGIRIRLSNGSVIVKAEKQESGHLYV